MVLRVGVPSGHDHYIWTAHESIVDEESLQFAEQKAVSVADFLS